MLPMGKDYCHEWITTRQEWKSLFIPDGTSPNSADVLNGFSHNTTCPPGKGDVCAIVAWYFDNEGKGKFAKKS